MLTEGKHESERGVRGPGSMRARPTVTLLGIGLVLTWVGQATAWPRYNDGCQTCHGSFDSGVSPQGTEFPGDDKHKMHRDSAYMGTDCDLCHTDGDDHNPWLGSSNGTEHNPGVGCTGCHGRDYGGSVGISAVGLRAHHSGAGIGICGVCHSSDPEPLPEDVVPPYYGTPDTNADDPCNEPPDYLENWSVGDTIGLDNDGDGEYDECAAPPLCAGDTNCDGIVDYGDIDPFVAALSCLGGDPGCWDPNCPWLNADCNGDGDVTYDDIDPFVAEIGATCQ